MNVEPRKSIFRLALMLWAIHLSGCTTSTPVTEAVQHGSDLAWRSEAVTPEPLHIANAPLLPALDINVAIFGIGADAEAASAHMAVRKLEARLLPGLLRDALSSSHQWGAVRVVPSVSALAPVNIETTIVASNGRDLILDVRVSDITGEQWFVLRLADRQDEPADDLAALSEMFYVVSNRMREYWLRLSEAQRKRLMLTTDMLYARELAPEVFGDYLDDNSPSVALKRMPASNDPMLGRVQRIKNHEYLFCDAIDEQLGILLERAGPTYQLWRLAATEQANWLDYYEAMAASRPSGKGDGEFSRMQASYSAYRSFRIQDQALVELAQALTGESEPVVLNTEDAVITLEGTLEAQYATWRGLLREIFLLEQGRSP